MATQSKSERERGRLIVRSLLSAVVGLTLGACESLLEVSLPGNLTEDDLFQPASAEILVNSAIADFECAFSMYTAIVSGSEDSTWKTSGYFGDMTEYQTLRPGGAGCTQNTDVGTNWFAGFQKSRLLSETAYDYLTAWTDTEVPDRTRFLATTAVYAGLFYATTGEVYCEFAVDGQGLMTPTETLKRAEDWFTKALGHIGTADFTAPSTTSLKQLAYLLRARVRLAMGDKAGAAADAALVGTGFVAWVTRDATVRPRWNAVNQTFNASKYRSFAGPVYWYGHDPTRIVAPGVLNLTIAASGRPSVSNGTADPRVRIVDTGVLSQDGVTRQYRADKYTNNADDQRLATWAEAQYILAEVDIANNALASAVSRINAVRTRSGITTAFASTNSDDIYAVLIEERRREFFLEGRHYADKLRYGLWFPRGRGFNHKSVRYQFQYCFLMPVSAYELNPEITEGYIGPDLTDLNYKFKLTVNRVANWPVS